jgi:hypothetical protein
MLNRQRSQMLLVELLPETIQNRLKKRSRVPDHAGCFQTSHCTSGPAVQSMLCKPLPPLNQSRSGRRRHASLRNLIVLASTKSVRPARIAQRAKLGLAVRLLFAFGQAHPCETTAAASLMVFNQLLEQQDARLRHERSQCLDDPFDFLQGIVMC